jgi:hypothetical protein
MLFAHVWGHVGHDANMGRVAKGASANSAPTINWARKRKGRPESRPFNTPPMPGYLFPSRRMARPASYPVLSSLAMSFTCGGRKRS